MTTLWSTGGALGALSGELDRMLSPGRPGITPAADVVETDAAFRVSLDLPGHDPKGIDIQVEDDTLTIRSERRFQVPPDGEVVHRSERAYGAATRAFVLPKTVDASKVEASYDAGVLTVTLPKREDSRPRTIPVRGG
jgi:HSP20 family protein